MSWCVIPPLPQVQRGTGRTSPIRCRSRTVQRLARSCARARGWDGRAAGGDERVRAGQAAAAGGRRRAGYDTYRREFSKLIWQLASPKWGFDDATFARSAAAFDNPDHVAIVIHNNRWRLGAAGEPQYEDVEARLADFPAIAVPTITLEGDGDGAPHADASAYAGKFSGKYEHRVIEGPASARSSGIEVGMGRVAAASSAACAGPRRACGRRRPVEHQRFHWGDPTVEIVASPLTHPQGRQQ